MHGATFSKRFFFMSEVEEILMRYLQYISFNSSGEKKKMYKTVICITFLWSIILLATTGSSCSKSQGV